MRLQFKDFWTCDRNREEYFGLLPHSRGAAQFFILPDETGSELELVYMCGAALYRGSRQRGVCLC